ncbi:MAG: hypothetical protein PHF51_02970 [Candidatus ainarchaeum sp.]|nr:hypothetical protein [Candidatus ainarchaeum sp.]
MSRFSIIAAILLLSSIAGAATSSDGCLENLIACEDACCTGAGGQASGEGCLTGTDAQANAFFSCDEACGSAAIRCISPNSGCDSQFRSCAQACTGSGQERQDCFESCSFAGIMCADEASESGSGSGGCCGSGAILALGAAGTLLFAGRA